MFQKPMLCGLKKETDIVRPYIWERKFDGERAVIDLSPNGRLIYARSGREKNRMYPDLDIQVKKPCILDGEITAMSGKFNDIQHRANRENGIKEAAKVYPVKYNVFDVISINGQSVTALALTQRKQLLQELIIPNPTCEIAQTFTDGPALWQLAQSNGWEGIIGKRPQSPYVFNARGEDWIKVKCLKQGVFWVVGYTAGTGWRANSFGSMVLADLVSGKLVHIGEVGTGFDAQELSILDSMLKSRPWTGPSPFFYQTSVTWVDPFAVTVEYLEMTNDGKLRFPSYKGRVI